MSSLDQNAFIKRNITLNTNYSINPGNLQNPSWFLSRPLKNVVGVKVKDVIIPNTFYTIDSRNNNFSIIENSGGNKTVSTIQLLPGNYTATSLMATLGNILTNNNVTGSTYASVYNSFTNTMTLTQTVGSLAGAGFNVATVGNSMNYELGFTNQQANTVSSSITSITSKNGIDLSGIKALNICAPVFGNVSEVIGSNFSILATVPITAPYLGINTLIDYSADYLSISQNSVDNISLLLYDEQMRTITINNNYQITCGFQIRL